MAPPCKVFVSKDRMATFTCPECTLVKRVDVSKYVKNQKAVKLNCRCGCGYTYPVFLERRKHVRKACSFAGELIRDRQSYPVTVVDLSRSGMKVAVGRNLKPQPGEKLWVAFTLDDANRSTVKKEVIVRSFEGNRMGVEFLSQDHYDKLGAYLLYSF